MTDCGFRWQTGDEPVDTCIRPAGIAHGTKHVSADGSWLLADPDVEKDYEVKE